jgi:formamidopyrimidine-DNA glycosylase
MPELPEVEAAMDVLRRWAKGRTIARATLLHPSFRRRISPVRLRSLVGAQVERVERRGKHQLLHLDDGRILHAHFRMNGDWEFGKAGDELPRFARAVLEFSDDTRIVFVDSRALGTIELHAAGAALDLGLGPDASDSSWTAEQLGTALATRRGPIKPALLDQKLLAGLGNIYAAESLWRARIDPRASSSSLTPAQRCSSEQQVRATPMTVQSISTCTIEKGSRAVAARQPSSESCRRDAAHTSVPIARLAERLSREPPTARP